MKIKILSGTNYYVLTLYNITRFNIIVGSRSKSRYVIRCLMFKIIYKNCQIYSILHILDC